MCRLRLHLPCNRKHGTSQNMPPSSQLVFFSGGPLFSLGRVRQSLCDGQRLFTFFSPPFHAIFSPHSLHSAIVSFTPFTSPQQTPSGFLHSKTRNAPGHSCGRASRSSTWSPQSLSPWNCCRRVVPRKLG